MERERIGTSERDGELSRREDIGSSRAAADCVWSRDRAEPTVGREKWRKDQSASDIMDGSSSLPRRCHLCLFTSVRARAPRAE